MKTEFPCGAVERNPTSIHEDAGLILIRNPALPVSCGVDRRRGSDPTLLWLWCRPAAAALNGLLAWEPPNAVGAALKDKKKR